MSDKTIPSTSGLERSVPNRPPIVAPNRSSTAPTKTAMASSVVGPVNQNPDPAVDYTNVLTCERKLVRREFIDMSRKRTKENGIHMNR